MTLVVIGIIAFMFMKKGKGGILPSEEMKGKVTLATGKKITIEILKGQVIPEKSEEGFLIRPEKCPIGYKQSIFTGKCIPESVIQK